MTTSQFEGRLQSEPELLTRSQKDLLKRVAECSPLPLSEADSQIDELRMLIASGYISLKVVQHAWGLDFELVATHKSVGGAMRE